MSSKNKRPEEIKQILENRVNDARYQKNLSLLAKNQNWSQNGLNKQIEKLSYLCDLIQDENKCIKDLLNSIESFCQQPVQPPIGSSKPILGIDLGTSRSTIGYYRINARGRSEMEIVANNQGLRSNPSVICIYKDKIYFGDEAIKMSAKCPENLIYDTKRMLGRKYNDEYIQNMKNYWTFNITSSKNGDILIEADKKQYYPYQISAYILTALMELANSHLKEKTNQAIITIPAYFTKQQREETKKAAEKAGIKLLDLVEEPKAATFCYGYKTEDAENSKKSRDIVVYDFGGGTLDVSYVEIKGNSFNVLAMDGDPLLGGQDFTNCILDNIASFIDNGCNKNWRNDARFVSYIKSQCDEAKVYLSEQNDYDFYLDIPLQLQKNNNSCLEFNITRKDFERMANELFERSMNPVIKVIKKVGRDPRNIDGLVLIGGSSYLPKIRNKLKEITQKDAFHGVCPVEAVAYGAITIAKKYIQGSMPKYTKNDPNIDENEKFLSGISVHDGSANEGKSPYIIEIEKIKNNLPCYDIMIEEGVQLPFSKETLIYSNEVQILKNSKTVTLGIFKNQNKTRKRLGNVKFDISQITFSSQNIPLANIRLTQNKSGLFYATQKPSSHHWTSDKKLEVEEKKKKKRHIE